MARFMLGGWTSLFSSHFHDCASPYDLKIMSQLCEELYCARLIGHVRGEE
jgi:hypothetical protein